MRLDKSYYGGHVGDTEFSWGPGLVPPGKEHAPPSEGGMYRPKAPKVVGNLNGRPGLRVAPLHRDDPPPGYPGDPVAK